MCESFDITIPNNTVIRIEQEANFESFLGQFQHLTSKILCVVNGKFLHFYDKSSIPSSIRFDHKQRKETLTEYYFVNLFNNDTYCVFGKDSAKLFYPLLDRIDPDTDRDSIVHVHPTSSRKSKRIYTPIVDQNISITDNNTEFKFYNPNYPVIIKTHY